MAQVKVFGGLVVEFAFAGEDEFEVVAIAGRALRRKESADWIMRKLSRADETRIFEALESEAQDARDDARIDAYEMGRIWA